MEFKFNSFKNRAVDPNLTKWEKIGFPDEYRKGREYDIFLDISNKLDLERENKRILDIGCGCGDLVTILAKHSEAMNNELVLVDSAEMLSNIDDPIVINNNKIKLLPGRFPEELSSFIQTEKNSFDAILVYSVIQYVFLESSIFSFIHSCVDLLKPGGLLLIGDIPNISVRERFLKSDAGLEFMKNSENSTGIIQHENYERMDDSILFAIMSRFRSFNCETYLLPQNPKLPFGNRREDIIIKKR